MPGGDRTGPVGMGAMTGRGAGYCNSNQPAGYGYTTPQPLNGRGARGGGGFGGGRGRRNMFYATGQRGWMFTDVNTANGVSETQMLKNQAEALKAELALVNQRLAEAEKTDKA